MRAAASSFITSILVLRLHTVSHTSYVFCASEVLVKKSFTIYFRITQLPVYPNETSDCVSNFTLLADLANICRHLLIPIVAGQAYVLPRYLHRNGVE